MTTETPSPGARPGAAAAAPGDRAAAPRAPEPSRALSLAVRLSGAALVAAAAVVFAVIESFLVPFRSGGAYVPVSAVLAVLVNAGLTVLAVWLTQNRVAALLPGVVWFAVVVAFSLPTGEGDLVIAGTWPGMLMIVLGAVSATIAGYVAATRRR